MAGVPVILHTFHGHVLRGYFGRLKSGVFIQIERLLARITTRLITLSDELKKELIHIGIGKEEKFEVIPLGLELKPLLESEDYEGEFKKELGLSGDAVIIGTVGRLVPIKGHKLFLEAARLILKEFGVKSLESRDKSSESGAQSPVKFVVVGDGELREELEEYSKELGIKNNVVFTGFRRDLPKIYSDLDVVVLSSINEGTPVSIIEAMASGKPLVSTNVGGVPSLVKDGITGFLVKSGDINALSEVISRLVKDPDLRHKMGGEGQRGVFPLYDISELTKRMDRLYTQVIKEVGGRE